LALEKVAAAVRLVTLAALANPFLAITTAIVALLATTEQGRGALAELGASFTALARTIETSRIPQALDVIGDAFDDFFEGAAAGFASLLPADLAAQFQQQGAGILRAVGGGRVKGEADSGHMAVTPAPVGFERVEQTWVRLQEAVVARDTIPQQQLVT